MSNKNKSGFYETDFEATAEERNAAASMGDFLSGKIDFANKPINTGEWEYPSEHVYFRKRFRTKALETHFYHESDLYTNAEMNHMRLVRRAQKNISATPPAYVKSTPVIKPMHVEAEIPVKIESQPIQAIPFKDTMPEVTQESIVSPPHPAASEIIDRPIITSKLIEIVPTIDEISNVSIIEEPAVATLPDESTLSEAKAFTFSEQEPNRSKLFYFQESAPEEAQKPKVSPTLPPVSIQVSAPVEPKPTKSKFFNKKAKKDVKIEEKPTTKKVKANKKDYEAGSRKKNPLPSHKKIAPRSRTQTEKDLEYQRIQGLINQDGYYNNVVPQDEGRQIKQGRSKSLILKICGLSAAMLVIIIGSVYYFYYYM